MARGLLQGDANQDGVLQKSELPEQFQENFAEYDKNGDGVIDLEELAQWEQELSSRRESSRESSRDPIVYGIAVADDSLIVRTGTRLYRLTGASKAPAEGSSN